MTGEPAAVFPGLEPPEITGEAEFGEPTGVTCSGFWIEAGSVSSAAAADVKAGLATKGGFPETLANGFSIEAGIAFNIDAASASDGLAIEAASVAPVFTLGLAVCGTPGEGAEADGVTSGVAVICAVFGTTAPSGNVVCGDDAPA